jgi:GH25 family lysozyme M1 (1,4-beta-N-acetylmuramidase)
MATTIRIRACTGRGPWPIQGIDVARYQGRIDFSAARGGGTHFVFIKSTEGKDYIDPNFYDNWNRAGRPAWRAAPITS